MAKLKPLLKNLASNLAPKTESSTNRWVRQGDWQLHNVHNCTVTASMCSKLKKDVMLVCLLLYPTRGTTLQSGNATVSLRLLAIDPHLKISACIPVKEDGGLWSMQGIVQNCNVLALWNAWTRNWYGWQNRGICSYHPSFFFRCASPNGGYLCVNVNRCNVLSTWKGKGKGCPACAASLDSPHADVCPFCSASVAYHVWRSSLTAH
jgi:hypothetical protein